MGGEGPGLLGHPRKKEKEGPCPLQGYSEENFSLSGNRAGKEGGTGLWEGW